MRFLKIRYRAILAAALTLPCSAGLPAAELPLEDLRADVDAIVEPLVKKNRGLVKPKPAVVGLVVGLLDGEESQTFGYGVVSLDDRRKPDGDTVFEIGSITKVFTATLLELARERGEVQLDDPVREYLPGDVRVPSRDGREITLEDLATHASGLPRIPPNNRPSDRNNPYVDYRDRDLYAFLSGHELRRAPGEKVEYSNLGAGLLGLALSHAAGLSYEDLVAQRMLRPLGLTRTGVALTPEMAGALAPPYSRYGKRAANWDFAALAGAGALRSTANDMLRFLAANLGLVETDLLPALQGTYRPRRQVNEIVSQGLSWVVVRPPGIDEPLVVHDGGTGGYRSWIAFLPESGVGVVLLTNTLAEIDPLGIPLLKRLQKRRSTGVASVTPNSSND